MHGCDCCGDNNYEFIHQPGLVLLFVVRTYCAMGNICPCLCPTEHSYQEVHQPNELKPSSERSVVDVPEPPAAVQHVEIPHISNRSNSTEVYEF